MDEISRWRGQSVGLRESEVGKTATLLSILFKGIEDERDVTQGLSADLDADFRAGRISRQRWEQKKRDLRREMSQFIDNRRESEMFAGLPLTFEERVAFAQEHNTLPPIRGPLEEAVSLYFEFEPEDFEFFNDDTGFFQIDWVGYFAYQKAVEQGLPESNQGEFKQRVSRWDTELDAIRRSDYDEYIKPYKAIFGIVLQSFPEEQQATIKRFYATDSSDEREQLRTVQLSEGSEDTLIADFQRQSNELKRVVRRVDPEMDARLTLWGEVTTPVTEEAKDIQRKLWARYGLTGRAIESMN